MTERPARLALAISSHAGDHAVLDRIQEASSSDARSLLSAVAVVDSGSTTGRDRLGPEIRRRYPDVDYLWYEQNLGAAGNLIKRLEWAQRNEADLLLAVNSDGAVIGRNLRLMRAQFQPDVGAVYPTYVIEESWVDLSWCRPIPVLPSRVAVDRLAGGTVLPVRWGSSNGAMYRTAALASLDLEDVLALWHGWEDLAVGLGLGELSYRQLLSLEAVQPSASDQRRLAGSRAVVSDKAPWTTYYGVRNLLLVARRHPRLLHRALLRVSREFLAVAWRDRRKERYRLALRGLVDGIAARTGPRVVPSDSGGSHC